MKKWTKATLAAVTLAGSLSAVATTASSANAAARKAGPVNGGTLTISQFSAFDPEFIPSMATTGYTQEIVNFAFDGLLTVDKNFNYKPWLAKSWTWSSDKKSLTMELQPNAKWSDGKPITSDDLLFYLDFLASKDYNTTLQGQNEYLVDPLLGSDLIMNGKKTSFAQTGGFRKISNTKFVVTFKKPDAAVLTSSVAGWTPLPKHVLGKIPFKDWLNTAYDRKPTVVSGPYMFVSVQQRDSVQMKANPLYWRGRAHINNVVWKTTNVDVQPGLLAKGDIDLILSGARAANMEQYKSMPHTTVAVTPGMNYSFMGMKLYKPEFKDLRVRQAFQYAVDRNAIVNGIQKGYASVISGPVPSTSSFAASTKDGLQAYNFNVAKANKLLDQAGWKKGAGGWRIDPATGKAANLPLAIGSGSTVGTAIATAFQQNMAAIGVKVTVSSEDFSNLMKKVESNDPSIYFWSQVWSLSTDPDPRGIWGTGNPNNFAQFNDKQDDALIAKTADLAAFDPAVRKKAMIAWQLDVNKKLPFIFLYQKDNTWVYNSRLHIPSQDITDWDLVNPQDWWLQ